MVARFWRARVKRGKDAGSPNSSAIRATEDDARRRLAAARTGRPLVDGALARRLPPLRAQRLAQVGRRPLRRIDVHVHSRAELEPGADRQPGDDVDVPAEL